MEGWWEHAFLLPFYLPHDDGVGKVVLPEGEGLPLPDGEPVGEHDVEAE